VEAALVTYNGVAGGISRGLGGHGGAPETGLPQQPFTPQKSSPPGGLFFSKLACVTSPLKEPLKDLDNRGHLITLRVG